jgi:hypothetical protein
MAAFERRSNREKYSVYHLTHVNNLERILRDGLLSRAELQRRAIAFTDVADPEILDGRSERGLDDHVPFHFITMSPFDYAVVRSHSDPRFVIIGVMRSHARRQRWKITPRHPLADHAELQLFEWDEGLEAIDWEQLDRYPRPYEDHECKMACMCEALAGSCVQPDEFHSIYTPNAEIQMEVERMVGGRNIIVRLNEKMFPSG